MFYILILLLYATEHIGGWVLTGVVQFLIELSIELLHIFLSFLFIHL